MKERPILFSGEMARAILDGRKTQTRRVIKPQPHPSIAQPAVGQYFQKPCPYGVPGDRLWVKETYHQHYMGDELGGRPCYRADNGCASPNAIGWKSSIHMPRWASRITLEITGVRVQRVQNIGHLDIWAEGLGENPDPEYGRTPYNYGRDKLLFEQLWNSINAKRGFGWDSNPWVWVVEFKRV